MYNAREIKQCHHYGYSKQKTVKPVQETPVTGKKRTGILDPQASFHHRFHKVAKSTGNNHQQADDQPGMQFNGLEKPGIQDPCKHSHHTATKDAFP